MTNDVQYQSVSVTSMHESKGHKGKVQSNDEEERDEGQSKSVNREHTSASGGRKQGVPADSVFDTALLPKNDVGEEMTVQFVKRRKAEMKNT